MQLGSFLEKLFAKAVVLNVHDSELCIYSSVSCSDSEAGVNVDEMQLSTVLSTMNVCRIYYTFSIYIYWCCQFLGHGEIELGTLPCLLPRTCSRAVFCNVFEGIITCYPASTSLKLEFLAYRKLEFWTPGLLKQRTYSSSN